MTAKPKRDNPGNSTQFPPELAFDPIDAALREIHDSIAAEEIPDDFLRLLEQLDERSIKRSPT